MEAIQTLEERLSKITGNEYRKLVISKLEKCLSCEADNRNKYLKEISSYYDNRNILPKELGDLINKLNLEIIKSEAKIELLYGIIYLGGVNV